MHVCLFVCLSVCLTAEKERQEWGKGEGFLRSPRTRGKKEGGGGEGL